MPKLLFLAAAFLAAPPAAAEPDWREAETYEVRLDAWSYEPRTIRLEAGQPVRLRLLNYGTTGLHFHAPSFFAAARIRDEEGEPPVGRGVKVPAGAERTVVLVPAPGSYRVRSANLLHRLLGQSARIIVE